MSNLKILVLGASGMMGVALIKKLKQNHDVTSLGRTICFNSQRHIGICITSEDFGFHLRNNFYDVIINCVAIVDHRFCSENPEKCMSINALINHKICQNISTPTRVFFISSDAVFSDETKFRKPQTCTSSQSIYGLSKELGEKILFMYKGKIDFNIIRTTIVGFSPKNRGLANWIVDSLIKKKKITLFDDVVFNPISIWDLAIEIDFLINSNKTFNGQVLHINGRENYSKHTFGLKLCDSLGLDSKLITKGKLSEFKLKGNRCFNQVLETSTYSSKTNRVLPGIIKTMESFKAEYNEYY